MNCISVSQNSYLKAKLLLPRKTKLYLHHYGIVTVCNLYLEFILSLIEMGLVDQKDKNIEAKVRRHHFCCDSAKVHRQKFVILLLKKYPMWKKKNHIFPDFCIFLYCEPDSFLHRLSVSINYTGQSGQRHTNTMLIYELGGVFRFLANKAYL